MNILNLPAWSVLDTREADHDYHITVQLSYPPRRDGGAFPRKPRRYAGLLLCPRQINARIFKGNQKPLVWRGLGRWLSWDDYVIQINADVAPSQYMRSLRIRMHALNIDRVKLKTIPAIKYPIGLQPLIGVRACVQLASMVNPSTMECCRRIPNVLSAINRTNDCVDPAESPGELRVARFHSASASTASAQLTISPSLAVATQR